MIYVDSLLNLPLPLLILGVFVILVVASELGFLAGVFIRRRFQQEKAVVLDVDNNVATITNSSLALLALFLGFTFSSALDHFEKNRESVSNEASAIVATYQIAHMQPSPYNERLIDQLGRYIDVRLGVADLANDPQAIRALQSAGRTEQAKLWAIANQMVKNKPDAPMLGNLVEALNNLVSAELTRTDNLLNGVPTGLFVPVALFLLFNGVLLGVSLGEGKQRHVVLSWGLYLLVALAVGIIVDLDRPLKGFINVDQDAMIALKWMR